MRFEDCKDAQTGNVRVAFDLLAQRHQRFVAYLNRDLYTQRVQELLSSYLAAMETDVLILDIGCGSGHWANWVAQQGFAVHPFDLSWNMVSLAHQSAPHIPHVQIDAQWIGLADHQYSLLMAVGDALSYVQSINQTLTELKRVAKPGAVLVGTVISTGGVLVSELAQHNYTQATQLVEDGSWVERTVEELQQLVSDGREYNTTKSLRGPLRLTTYTSDRLKTVLQSTPATVLTIQGIGVLRRLGIERIEIPTQEQMELERKLAQLSPWKDISTNLFFAVRLD